MSYPTKHFVDAQGRYLGAWSTPAAEHPAGGVEVPAAPAHGADTWDGVKWNAGARPAAARDVLAELDQLAARVQAVEAR